MYNIFGLRVPEYSNVVTKKDKEKYNNNLTNLSIDEDHCCFDKRNLQVIDMKDPKKLQ